MVFMLILYGFHVGKYVYQFDDGSVMGYRPSCSLKDSSETLPGVPIGKWVMYTSSKRHFFRGEIRLASGVYPGVVQSTKQRLVSLAEIMAGQPRTPARNKALNHWIH